MPEIVKADGGVIHYDLQGEPDRPAFVLLEGLGAHMVGWRREFYEPIVDAGYRVVRLDNRDVGLSQRYPKGNYRLSDLAQDTHELIAQLGIGPVHVVGQSMGGLVAQHLALDHPDDVASLSLIYSTPSPRYVSRFRQVDALLAAPRAHSRDEAVELHVESERIGASRNYSWDEEWKRELGGLMWDRGYDPAGVIRQSEALLSDQIDEGELSTLRMPVLIVHGTDDALISHEAAIALNSAIPGSELWLIEGMGHDLPLELIPQLTTRIVANAQRAATQTVTETKPS